MDGNLQESNFETISVGNDFEGFDDEYVDSEYESQEVLGGYKEELSDLEKNIYENSGIYSQDVVQCLLDENRIDLLDVYKQSLDENDQRELERFVDIYNQEDDTSYFDPMKNLGKKEGKGDSVNFGKNGSVSSKNKGMYENNIDNYQYAA